MMSPSRPLLVLLLGGALAACGNAGGKQSELAQTEAAAATPSTASAGREIRVETARIQASDASIELSLPAEVMGSHDALLASPGGGYVEKVYVDEGSEVRRGQPIAAIDRASATARRDQAQARLELAASELQRVETMGDLASAQQLQQARTQHKLAEADLALAETAWQRSLITAPFDGVVGQVGIEVGEVAGPGSPVARLVQLDPIELSISVADRDVVGLKAGMPVRVQTDASGQVFDGELMAISPAADLSTRSFVVKATVANPDHTLLPGMIARVSLAERLASDAVVIPQDWLVTRIDGVGVYVVEEGVAHWRAVTAGQVVHDQVVIDQGLAVGETIVITGHRSLADGDALLVSRNGVCCTQGRAVF